MTLLPPAKQLPGAYCPVQAISAWLPKAATWTRAQAYQKKRTPFPRRLRPHLRRPHASDRTAGHLLLAAMWARPKFVIDAIAAGKKPPFPAPLRARGPEPDDRPQPPRVSQLDKRNVALPTACFDAPVRQALAAFPARKRARRSHDPRCTFTEEQVKGVPLPLGCGVSIVGHQPLHRLRRAVVITNRCLGCGVVRPDAARFDAIHLAAITRKRPSARGQDESHSPYMVKRAARIKGQGTARQTQLKPLFITDVSPPMPFRASA